MAAKHGTANCYNQGCRCDACRYSHRLRAANYRQRRSVLAIATPTSGEEFSSPGPVEAGVQAEIAELADARPGVAQMALAMARILDSKAVSQQPAAAKVLVMLLDKLHQAGAPGRRGRLTGVRTLTAPTTRT